MAVRVFVRTFIAAQLYVSKQSNLDNLPEESKHQVRFSLPQILGSDIDNLAADGRGWIQSEVQILLLGKANWSFKIHNKTSDDRGQNRGSCIIMYIQWCSWSNATYTTD